MAAACRLVEEEGRKKLAPPPNSLRNRLNPLGGAHTRKGVYNGRCVHAYLA